MQWRAVVGLYALFAALRCAQFVLYLCALYAAVWVCANAGTLFWSRPKSGPSAPNARGAGHRGQSRSPLRYDAQ